MNLFAYKIGINKTDISLKQIIYGWVILNLINLCIPLYLVWISPASPLGIVYLGILSFQLLLIPMSGLLFLYLFVKGIFSSKQYFNQSVIWLMVGILSAIAIMFYRSNYYDNLKILHFNSHYVAYEEAVKKVSKRVSEQGQDYQEYDKGFYIANAPLSTFSLGTGKDIQLISVSFYKNGRGPLIRGGIIYFENDSQSVRKWHLKKTEWGETLLITEVNKGKYYKKIRPHWYLYTIF